VSLLQRDYKFVYLDAKITKTSSEYFGKNCAMEVVKYNNSMPILNATFSVIKTCPEETTVSDWKYNFFLIQELRVFKEAHLDL
jgi:hypothetical protein